MFRPFRTYRHKKCLDVDVQIISIPYPGPNYWKMKVYYLNRHWQNGQFVIAPDKIKVRTEDFKNWVEVTTPLVF